MPPPDIHRPAITILDGPMGTELEARGVSTALPKWSASALFDAPHVVAAIHADYAQAGATVHTTNTFRARARTLGPQWRRAAQTAVRLARTSIPSTHRVAGSIAPLEDCYRPDLSPADCRREHRDLIEVLAAEGCDLMLVETFPLAREAWTAVEEAVHTGLETWASFTAGPHGDLLTPEDLRSAALGAVERGAGAVLVNCVAATKVGPYVDALAGLGVPVGAYANAGKIDEAVGWRRDTTLDTNLYETLARGWAERGATILGGCCGTGPQHIAALSQALT